MGVQTPSVPLTDPRHMLGTGHYVRKGGGIQNGRVGQVEDLCLKNESWGRGVGGLAMLNMGQKRF